MEILNDCYNSQSVSVKAERLSTVELLLNHNVIKGGKQPHRLKGAEVQVLPLSSGHFQTFPALMERRGTHVHVLRTAF